jgi:restriction system protein
MDEGFAGLGFDFPQDLSGKFGSNWRDFNDQFIPVWLSHNSGKNKRIAGLSCGALWTFGEGLKVGDYILSPDDAGNFYAGKVTGDYFYEHSGPLPHRRPIEWIPEPIRKSLFSEEFQRSTRSALSNIDVDRFADEIAALIAGKKPPEITIADPDVENATVFALERHLEDFLVSNWQNTHFGATHDLWTEDGEIVGQQFPSDTGPIDLLAISKDGSELLVIELKRGRVSDAVVGQIQRYMGFVKSELAEKNQTVRGVIIGLEADLRVERALSVAVNIEFYRYQVDFKLFKD